MEGAAFFYVCSMEHIPFIQLRAISNRVELRNRKAWKMDLALANVAQVPQFSSEDAIGEGYVEIARYRELGRRLGMDVRNPRTFTIVPLSRWGARRHPRATAWRSQEGRRSPALLSLTRYTQKELMRNDRKPT